MLKCYDSIQVRRPHAACARDVLRIDFLPWLFPSNFDNSLVTARRTLHQTLLYVLDLTLLSHRPAPRLKSTKNCWMQVGGIWRGCGSSHRISALSRTRLQRTHFSPVRPLLACKVRMGSTKPEPPEWTALRVRETFLDYFKRNGHTFGAFA